VCDHFGFQIRWFSVVYPVDDGFECVSEHGPCRNQPHVHGPPFGSTSA
jgi:hypothetical protein